MSFLGTFRLIVQPFESFAQARAAAILARQGRIEEAKAVYE